MKNALVRLLCRLLAVCLGVFPLGSYAAMISTDQVVAAQYAGAREKVRRFVARAEVRGQLQALGVSPTAAQARVNALTDAELASVAGRIDQLPAGGIGSIWAVVFTLIILELIILNWVD
jgi:hypothetical protein